VEEEFHLVDLRTRCLAPRAPELLERLPSASYAPELQQSVVESNSSVFADLSALRDNLLSLRRVLATEAEALGLAIVCAGTVPLVDLDALSLTDNDRFAHMASEYQLLVREQLICGAQVHVDVPDRDHAVAVARRLGPELPVLLALSASSPFWVGRDSGYASARSLMWQRWPTAGSHGEATTAREYDALLADLVASGTVSDTAMAYFDVRPSAHLPTIELRLTDACPDVDVVVLLAGLFRALVQRELAAVATGAPVDLPPAPLLRAAAWRAARSGLEGDLLDLPRSSAPVSAPVAVRALVQALRPQLEEAGDWPTVCELAESVLRRGSAAALQRRVLARTGRMEDVVDELVRHTRGEVPGGTLWTGYGADGDEALTPAEEVAAPYGAVLPALDALGPGGMDRREQERDSLQRRDGVTFSGDREQRLFPVDLVPRLVSADDWSALSAGLVQRAQALDAFLRDVYDERRILADGRLPSWVVDRSPGWDPAGLHLRHQAVRSHVSGMDLVRDGAGHWCVLEDNLRVPSGLAYAMATRRLLQEVLPEVPAPPQVLSVEDVPRLLLEALVAAAPPRTPDDGPRVVLLTEGPTDSAWFEHRTLAEEMGVPAVLPHELVAEGDALLHVGADGRRHGVDVVYLRIGAIAMAQRAAADGRPVGAVLMEVARQGALTLANAPGNGVGDDKALYAFVPDLVRYYLGQEPLLENVPTYVCREPDQLEEALSRAAQLVFKPVDGYGGQGVLVGPRATEQELEATLDAVRAHPAGWIAQETVALSTMPTYDAGRLCPRHVDLRAFVLLGDRAVVAPAALTRVAPAGSLVVNSSRGGGAKDTWLLG